MRLRKRRKGKDYLEEVMSTVKKQPFIAPKVNEEDEFYPDYLFKVLLIGHNDSGKISHLETFGNSWFKANTKLSIGISFEIKEIKIENLYIKLQIWDIATQDHWRIMVPYYSRGALGAIFMFEVSDSRTLEALLPWIQTIRENTTNIPIILMGNYDDLNDIRQISKEEGLEFVNSEGLDAYFECNVLTGENLNNIFESLIRMIIKNYEKKN